MPMIGEDRDEGHRVEGGLRKERYGEPQETVSPHLEEHAREDHAARGRRLGMRIGQPRMHREHGHLDGEREGEGGEQPVLEPDGHGPVVEVEHVEGVDARRLVVMEIEGEDGKEHQDAARPW